MVLKILRYAVKLIVLSVFVRLFITLIKPLFVLIKRRLTTKYKLSKNNKP